MPTDECKRYHSPSENTTNRKHKPFSFPSLMKRLYFTAILFLGTFFFCQAQKSEPVIDMDRALSAPLKPVKLSSIASSLEYIPLETNDSVLIGGTILHKYMTQDYILITDLAQTPYLFDRSGKFLCKLGRRGKGPGETTGLVSSLYVDPQTGRIFVFSSGNLFIFDTKGALLQEIPVTERVFGKTLYSAQYGGNDRHILYLRYDYGSTPPVYQIKTSDGEGRGAVSQPLTIGVRETVTPHSDPHIPPSRSYNNTVFFMPDHVCIFDETSLSMTEMAFDGTVERQYMVKKSSRNSDGSEIFIGNMTSTPRYYFLTVLSDKSRYAIYDKKKGQLTALPSDTEGLIDDLDNGRNFWCSGYSTEGEYFTTCPAHLFKESAELSDNPKLKEIAARLQEDDNPVIIVARPK